MSGARLAPWPPPQRPTLRDWLMLLLGAADVAVILGVVLRGS